MWIHHASSSWSWVSLGHQRSSPQQLFLNPSNTYCLLIFCAPLLPTRGLGDPGRLDVITLDVLGQELGPAGPAQEVRQTFPEEVDGLEGTREEERGHLGFHPPALHDVVRLEESVRALPVSHVTPKGMVGRNHFPSVRGHRELDVEPPITSSPEFPS